MRNLCPFPILRAFTGRIYDAKLRIGLLCVCLTACALQAFAGAPQYSDILPVNRIKPGMKGYGLTTFHGVTVSKFNVTVIGVLKNANSGHDLILIRMKGGPITERGANLIHGMSGSPVYIDGKIIGAFSQGEQWPKEPIGMVTPIQDMLEAWDPNIPQKPGYFQPAEARTKPPAVNLHQPITVGSRRITSLLLGAPSNRCSSTKTAALHYATSFLYAPGAKESICQWMQKSLEAKGYHYTVLADGGASGVSTFHGAPLKPGSCFGTMLATGDIPFGGYGTLTYRKGDRVLGFGHPLMGLGALEGAITSAYVVDVFSGLQTSHLIPIAGPVVGTLRQDRDFSVSGDLSSSPNLIPFEVTINDATTHRSQTFHDRLLQHPDLTAQLMSFVAKEAISRVHDIPGDVMARVTTSVDAAEIGTLTRTNTVYDAVDLSGPALMDLSDIMGVVSGNPFYPLPIKSGKITIDIRSGRQTATIERIFLKQGKFEPGETVDIGVVLKPYRLPEITRTVSLKIPQDTPGGHYTLSVRGGMANLIRVGGLTFGGGGELLTPPANAKQMAAQLSERETNTDIVARIPLNTYAPAVEGLKLSQMPPNLEALMRSERNSGIRIEREDVHCRKASGFIVSGSQQLTITVVRKNNQEVPSTRLQSTPSGSGGIPGLPNSLQSSGSLSGASIEDSADAAGLAPRLSAESSGYSLTSENRPPPNEQLASPVDNEQQPAAGSVLDKKPSDSASKTLPTAGFKVIEPIETGAPTSVADTTADKTEKPVARQPVVWRQYARNDLSPGKFTGTGVSTAGELRISAALTRLATTSETYIWSIVSDGNGAVYAGTGTTGKILKIDSAGHTTVFAVLPAVAVQTLIVSHDGTLWAGTGGNGAVYHVTLDGKATLVSTLSEHFAVALAEDPSGNLYIGAGGSGNIYRLTPEQQRSPRPLNPPDVFFKTPAQHILALAVDSDGSLLAGAAPDGILYRITPDGLGKVLYDARDNAIMAISTANTPASSQSSTARIAGAERRTNSSGDVYIATGPRGNIYAVHPDGSVSTLFDHAPLFFTALKTAPDGSLYASTAAAIYHITPTRSGTQDSVPAIVTPLDNKKDIDYLCLAVLPNGTVAAGTGNIGELFVSSNTPTETADAGTYESVVRDARVISHWGNIRWDGVTPTGARIKVSTRSGGTSEPDTDWSAWANVQSKNAESTGKIVSPPNRYIQYRLELSGATVRLAESPAVREISLSYMPKNQPPKVSFVNPSGGEEWSHTQTIRWNGSDPDNDTLDYTLEYSGDSGATWRPVFAESAKHDSAESTHLPASPSLPLPLSMSEFEKTLDPTMPPFLRQIALDKHKSVLDAGGRESAQRDSFRAWDTKSVPDGTYILRVSASDKPSNPTNSLGATAVSDPIVVCNALPVVRISGKPEVRPDRSVFVRGTATQNLASISAVQYRIDGGDWASATADDGIFDSGSEGFQFSTVSLSPGKHSIEVMTFNSAAEHSSIKLEVATP